MASKRRKKRVIAARMARKHEGKQIHPTKTEAILHADRLRRRFGALVHIYGCQEGGPGPNHWHVGSLKKSAK